MPTVNCYRPVFHALMSSITGIISDCGPSTLTAGLAGGDITNIPTNSKHNVCLCSDIDNSPLFPHCCPARANHKWIKTVQKGKISPKITQNFPKSLSSLCINHCKRCLGQCLEPTLICFSPRPLPTFGLAVAAWTGASLRWRGRPAGARWTRRVSTRCSAWWGGWRARSSSPAATWTWSWPTSRPVWPPLTGTARSRPSSQSAAWWTPQPAWLTSSWRNWSTWRLLSWPAWRISDLRSLENVVWRSLTSLNNSSTRYFCQVLSWHTSPVCLYI